MGASCCKLPEDSGAGPPHDLVDEYDGVEQSPPSFRDNAPREIMRKEPTPRKKESMRKEGTPRKKLVLQEKKDIPALGKVAILRDDDLPENEQYTEKTKPGVPERGDLQRKEEEQLAVEMNKEQLAIETKIAIEMKEEQLAIEMKEEQLAIEMKEEAEQLAVEKNKEQLAIEAKIFVRSASAGVACTMLDYEASRAYSAHYRLTGPSSESLSVTWSNQKMVAVFEIRTMRISTTNEDFGEEAQRLIETVLPHIDPRCIVRLQGAYSNSGTDKPPHAVIVFDHGEGADVFVRCCKFMQLYAKSAEGKTIFPVVDHV